MTDQPDQRLRWLRWIELVGPRLRLRHQAADVLHDRARLCAIWDGAAREIAARLVLAAVRERLVEGAVVDGSVSTSLPGGRLVIPLRATRAFELHRADLDRGDLDPRLTDPGAIADALATAILTPILGSAATAEVERVRAEILDSAINLASTRLAAVVRERLAEADPRSTDPRLTDPEHFVVDGHPWHPMTRTRMGLGRADNLRHAPEQVARVELRSVEVARDLAVVSGDWAEIGPTLGLPAHGDRVRIPVHPVQARRLPRLFPVLWGRGAIRPGPSPALDADGGPGARPLLSLRTLALPGHPLHLKLALGVHTTSARRVVSPMSAANGPRVSALVASIQRADAATRDLELLAEPAAIGLDPARVGPLARELGAIVRVAPPADAWVCAAIGDRWPGTGETVLERACVGYPGDLPARVRAAIGDWIAALVPPALRLATAHGIALELHLQNTLVRVQSGRIGPFAVRDLGGIRIHTPRLRASGRSLDLAPGSFIATDDLDEVLGKLEHVLFHAHLAHVFEVAAHLGVPEAESWARVQRALEGCLRRWATDPDEPERIRRAAAADLRRLTAPRVRAKALLSMRLHDRSSDYDYTEVDNVFTPARA